MLSCLTAIALLAVVSAAPASQEAHPLFSQVTCDYCHQAASPYLNRQGPHGGYTTITNKCYVCHTVHVASAGSVKLLPGSTVTNACLACHDGTGGDGVYGAIAARGVTVAAAHRSIPPTTNLIPGGDAVTGGSRVQTFTDATGYLSCDDCHSPHASNIVTAFDTERVRLNDVSQRESVSYSTNLLKQRPTGSDTTATEYGSDWCAGCHKGRHSGGAVVNHPVDSKAVRADPYAYGRLPVSAAFGAIDITVDATGNVWVCDPGNYRVQEFSPAGAFIRKWGTKGYPIDDTQGWGQFLGPQGIAVANGYVYVSDGPGGNIAKYTVNGSFVWPGTSQMSGNYLWPVGLGVDASGNVLMADSESMKVFKMGANIGYAGIWGSGRSDQWPSSANGEFFMPSDVAGDAAGNVYVADALNHRIQKLDSSGAYAAKWGSEGAAAGQFEEPMGIAIDGAGNVYVADSGNNRVQKFTLGGAFVAAWGTAGSGDGQFRFPKGITVDSSGNVYVVDAGNDRIQKFTSAGVFVAKWGSRGSAAGQVLFDATNIGSLGPNPPHTDFPLAYKSGRGGNRGFVMQDPRSPEQTGHGPICQQCHEDARNVGALYGGVASPYWMRANPDGRTSLIGTYGNPRFQTFPHESDTPKMLVESGDNLCANCHETTQLP